MGDLLTFGLAYTNPPPFKDKVTPLVIDREGDITSELQDKFDYAYSQIDSGFIGYHIPNIFVAPASTHYLTK